MENITASLVATAAGITKDSPLLEVLLQRNTIMNLTDQSYHAVISPIAPGGITHSERAALACRMAKLNHSPDLSTHYSTMINAVDTDLSDPDQETTGHPRRAAMARHTDIVTRSPKDVTNDDISELIKAGLTDADVVRLSELISFVNYQVRVVAGISLMSQFS